MPPIPLFIVPKKKSEFSGSETMNDSLSNLFNAIALYPIRNQVAIFITLDYINLGMDRVMPYNYFLPYEDDYHSMLEKLCSDATDEELSRMISLLVMDLETLLSPMQKAFTKTGKVRKNCKMSESTLMSYGLLLDALQRILKHFHTLSEQEINQLLEDREIDEGCIYFNSIEELSDEIIAAMFGGTINITKIPNQRKK